MVINDDNYKTLLGVRPCLTKPRITTYGNAVTAIEEKLTLIPRSEWLDRIKYMDENKCWLEDIVRSKLPGQNVPCTDQNGLGYCHSYSTVQAAMIRRLIQHNKFIHLSAESIGGPITNWKNRGAPMDDPMFQLRDVGACRQDFMNKEHSLSPRLWKEGWEQDCENHRADGWLDMDIRGKMFDAAATMCFLGHPFAAGFGWWSHAICGGFRVIYIGNRKGREIFALRYRNNWGSDFGDDGFLDMEEGKGTPDIGAFAPMHMTPSN